MAPHLKVIKHVINDNGGTANASDFGININGNNPIPSSFPGSETGTNVTIYPGWYDVYEYGLPGYKSTSSIECNGIINLGENKTCTITNDDIPKAQLVVIKHVINNDGGTASSSDFTMVVDNIFPAQSMFQGSETGTNVTIYEGYYNVWEYNRPDYSQNYSPDCSGIIKGGEIKTCTITNDDLLPAHLIVIKKVINNDGGTANPSDFTMFVNGNYPSPSTFPGSDNGTNVTIYPGWYNVDEYYNLPYIRSFSGDCSAYINSGETKTCTITNDDIPPPPPPK